MAIRNRLAAAVSHLTRVPLRLRSAKTVAVDRQFSKCCKCKQPRWSSSMQQMQQMHQEHGVLARLLPAMPTATAS